MRQFFKILAADLVAVIVAFITVCLVAYCYECHNKVAFDLEQRTERERKDSPYEDPKWDFVVKNNPEDLVAVFRVALQSNQWRPILDAIFEYTRTNKKY